MSKERIRTVPNLAATSPQLQAAITAGDDHFSAWQHNVADKYKCQTVAQIKQNLQETAHPFAVCMENWISDFNFSSLVRNANAFNAKEVFYLGDKKVDRRGMVGCQNYTDVSFLPTIEEFIKLSERFHIVGIDNVNGSIPISSYTWKPNTLIVFGAEAVGLTPTIQSLCEAIVEIKQFGSVRSLNCAVASGIVMYEFVKQFHAGQVL